MSKPLPPVEEELKGGLEAVGVVRIGDTVHRPVGERGDFVHAVLIRLAQAGYRACPRYLGLDEQGREVLTYVAGEVPHDWDQWRSSPWSDRQLSEAVALLRGFHDATSGAELAGSHEVVCHNDFAPWNTVFVGDVPTAIIDFNDMSPGSRARDVSYASWCWLGLGGAGHSVDEQARRLRLMSDVYGLPDRSNLVLEIRARQNEIRAAHLKAGRHGRVAIVDGDIQWIDTYASALNGALQ